MIQLQQTCLGIELGSTRIKAVAIGGDYRPISAGGYTWKSDYRDGMWTYDLAEVWAGLKAALSEVEDRESIAAMGVSAMMHGYLAFDKDWELLTPFRTWQNTMTGPAAAALTARFGFNIPQRWSIAHLYQAILNKEPHVARIAHITTLAGYAHHALTGENVLGIGDASGMFPVDSLTLDYDAGMLDKFTRLIASQGYLWNIRDLLPKVLPAGGPAGKLTERGARLLGGLLPAGIPLAPPEGDAGTGMVATNAVAPRTGNVSAGTSVFAMAVLERPLSGVHTEIDLVTTPAGAPVAMVHCNTCTSDLDAWVGLFGQALAAAGRELDKTELYTLLYRQALDGDLDCGGLNSCNYHSGEPITGIEEGRPLFVRLPNAALTLPNFMRTHLCAAIATLKLGVDILVEREHIALDKLLGHGGLFKVEGVAQRLLAGALGVPVAVMETAGEGGPWGSALLAAFMRERGHDERLEDFLAQRVFAASAERILLPSPEDSAGFAAFVERYQECLAVERAAGLHIK